MGRVRYLAEVLLVRVSLLDKSVGVHIRSEGREGCDEDEGLDREETAIEKERRRRTLLHHTPLSAQNKAVLPSALDIKNKTDSLNRQTWLNT